MPSLCLLDITVVLFTVRNRDSGYADIVVNRCKEWAIILRKFRSQIKQCNQRAQSRRPLSEHDVQKHSTKYARLLRPEITPCNLLKFPHGERCFSLRCTPVHLRRIAYWLMCRHLVKCRNASVELRNISVYSDRRMDGKCLFIAFTYVRTLYAHLHVG